MDSDTDPHGYEPDFDPYTPPPGQREPAEGATENADQQLRERLEKVDHKLGVRSYAGGLAIVIALAGAIVELRGADSATASQIDGIKGDLDDLKGQISDLGSSQDSSGSGGGVGTGGSSGLGDELRNALGGN